MSDIAVDSQDLAAPLDGRTSSGEGSDESATGDHTTAGMDERWVGVSPPTAVQAAALVPTPFP